MKRILLLYFFVFLGGLCLFPQKTDNAIEQLTGYINRYQTLHSLYPQEKVYLHFDNTGYFQGETIWFKAYVTRAESHHYTDMSRVLYVELLTPEGELVHTQKVKLENGQGHGFIPLDEKVLNCGFYEARAYTRYMLNWGSDMLFSRVFPVFSTPQKEGDYSKMKIADRTFRQRLPSARVEVEDDDNTSSGTKLSLNFFPEGGHSVCGVPSVVAFEATDREGAHVQCVGELYDDSDSLLCSFSTHHLGRGRFSYQPVANKEYHVKVRYKNKFYRFSLPPAEKKEGYTTVFTQLSKHQWQLDIYGNTGDMQDNLLGYAISCRGEYFLFDTLTVREDPTIITLSCEDMKAGVNEFILFDASGRVHSNRLFFVTPQKTEISSLTVNTGSFHYAPYAPVKMDFKLSGVADSIVFHTGFSVAVREHETMTNAYEHSIFTDLLLSSDLKGFIENPGFYFAKEDARHLYLLDLLMLVQGWRRYDWGKVLQDSCKIEINQPIEHALLLDGRVIYGYDARKKKSQVQLDSLSLRVDLYSLHGFSLSGEDYTRKNGRFFFEIPDIHGDLRLRLKLNDKLKGLKKYNFMINRSFSPQSRPFDYYATQLLPVPQWNHVGEIEENIIAAVDTSNYQYIKEIPEVEIKARRYRSARAAWEREDVGLRVSTMYYDVAKEVEGMKDRGEPVNELYEWLKDRNSYFTYKYVMHADSFSGVYQSHYWYSVTARKNDQIVLDTDDTQHEVEVRLKLLEDLRWKLKNGDLRLKLVENVGGTEPSMEVPKKSDMMFQVPLYKGRPVLVICDNHIYNEEKDGLLLAEDVKSVMIAEDSRIWKRYLPSTVLDNGAVIFIYTVFGNSDKPKPGIRNTYFQGFNEPKEFYSPDYRLLPRTEDYRRTLYWNPNVKLDEQGKASIEFFNNSTESRLVISAEGLTKDGRPFVFEHK